ncbi:hypothetical protein EVAR_75940_1 [Eumeta japonica]|uniref:Uncharacterized protein n=1 Tax=Eumeta variegata TaxID=151549 RepID=A0A4C1UXI6_EUMVA|nr:hypothetical protein EVAR_75940_1 [Eumeta japonica]
MGFNHIQWKLTCVLQINREKTCIHDFYCPDDGKGEQRKEYAKTVSCHVGNVTAFSYTSYAHECDDTVALLETAITQSVNEHTPWIAISPETHLLVNIRGDDTCTQSNTTVQWLLTLTSAVYRCL